MKNIKFPNFGKIFVISFLITKRILNFNVSAMQEVILIWHDSSWYVLFSAEVIAAVTKIAWEMWIYDSIPGRRYLSDPRWYLSSISDYHCVSTKGIYWGYIQGLGSNHYIFHRYVSRDSTGRICMVAQVVVTMFDAAIFLKIVGKGNLTN